MITHISQLDSDDRTTVCELILCDPYAGDLAREYLDVYTIQHGTMEHGTMELIDWLILAREACRYRGSRPRMSGQHGEHPDEQHDVRARARQMHAAGHGLLDIAGMLHTHPAQVERWLATMDHDEAAAAHARAWGQR